MSESDIVKDFLVESYENLDRLDRDLVGLEKNPQDREALAGVFRTIHTIKGTCGFLGFNKLEKVAHVGENLLTRLRDGKLTLNPEITTGLLGMVDAVRQMLKEIESTGQDGNADYAELRETLTKLQSSGTGDAGSLPAMAQSDRALGGDMKPLASQETAVAAQGSSQTTSGEVLFAAQDPDKGNRDRVHEAPAKPEEVLSPPPAPESRTRDGAPETIRVGVNLLDKLMTLVGELVLARNQLLQFSNNSEDTSLQAVSQRMNLIAQSLVALVHLSDLLCRVRGLGYGYYEKCKADLVYDPAWSMLLKVHRKLEGVDLALFTFELDGAVEEIYELVSGVFAPAAVRT